jgi:acyl carrier protein
MMRIALEEIFLRELNVRKEDFSDDLTYNSIPEWDSASHMAIVLAVEEVFGITLESEDIVRMTSVRKILDLLSAKGIGGV